MQQTTSAGSPAALPRSLQPGSLWRRAVFGILALVFGVVAAAWLLHASTGFPAAPVTAGQPAPASQN